MSGGEVGEIRPRLLSRIGKKMPPQNNIHTHVLLRKVGLQTNKYKDYRRETG